MFERIAHGAADQRVARRVGDDLERAEDRHTTLDQGREGTREARQRDLAEERSEDRQTHRELVEEGSARRGLLPSLA